MIEPVLKSSLLRFGLYTLCLLTVNAPALRQLYEFGSNNVTASHTLLVPFVVAVLIYSNRKAIFAAVAASLAPGAWLLLIGTALSIIGRLTIGDSANALTVTIAGFVASWIAGFVMFFGVSASRLASFPLAFLACMIPLPPIVIDAATQWLKSGSTETVARLFALTGTPYHRQGFVFTLPDFVIEVADECSGIRSSLALLLTSLLAGYQLLTRPWTKLLLVLAVFPIAVLKNAIRIVALSLLAMHVDPSFLTGQLHHEGGVVFFLLALALMAPLFSILQWSEGVTQNRAIAAAVPGDAARN